MRQAIKSKKAEPTLSKTPRKTRSEVEHLRGHIRELESENKSLKRRLRQYEKRENLYENNKEEIEEVLTSKALEETNPSKLKKCDDCGKGAYEEFEIMEKVFGTCNVCGHRKKLR